MKNRTFGRTGVFFTSDTHFNHANILNFCNRPFADVEEMNEELITRWNNVVGKNDTVFHLGDFCFGGAAEWTRLLDQLHGKIHLIVGNHDLKNLRQGIINRFGEVTMQSQIQIDEHLIYLNHYPFLCYSGAYRPEVWQLFGEVRLPRDFGKIMGMFSKDALQDFLKEHGSTYMALDKCEQKSLNRELNKLCTAFVKEVYMSHAYIIK